MHHVINMIDTQNIHWKKHYQACVSIVHMYMYVYIVCIVYITLAYTCTCIINYYIMTTCTMYNTSEDVVIFISTKVN